MRKLFIILLFIILILIVIFIVFSNKELEIEEIESVEDLNSNSLNLEDFYIPKISSSEKSTGQGSSAQGASIVSVYYFEATVLSIEQDNLNEKSDCQQHALAIGYNISQMCPKDKMLIRIDSFEGHEQARDFINSNPEQIVYLQYSSRPTQLIADEKPGCELEECPDYIIIDYAGVCSDQDGNVVNCNIADLQNKKTEFKDGFMIYHFAESYFKSMNIEEDKIYLQGIKAGDKVKFTDTSLCWQNQPYCLESDSRLSYLDLYEVI
ncbi:MAG: hypothetical protein AABX10_00360 [Nanoarchaeota archaeon]